MPIRSSTVGITIAVGVSGDNTARAAITGLKNAISTTSKDVSGFLSKASKEAGAFGQAFSNALKGNIPAELGAINNAIDVMPLGLTVAAGAALALGAALVKIGLDVTADAIAFDKLSQKVGASVKFLSGMSVVAKDADISIDALNTGLVRFNDYLDRTVGKGANLEAELFKLADTFQRMPDGPQKTALALDALGRSGIDLIPILNGGSEVLRRYLQDAQEAGRVISQETVEAAKKLDDQIDKLNGRFEALKLSIASGVIPVLNDLFVTSDRAGKGMEDFEKRLASAFDQVAKAIPGFNALVDSLFGVRPAASAAVGGMGYVITGFGAITGAAYTAATAVQTFSSVVAGLGGKGINVYSAIEAGRLKTKQISDSEKARTAYIAENRAQSALLTTQQRATTKAQALTAGYRAMADQIEQSKSANERYGVSWDDLTQKIVRGAGGAGKAIKDDLNAALEELESRTQRIKGLMGQSLEPMDKMAQLQQAYALATGEVTLEQVQQEQAIKAVMKAFETGQNSMQDTLAILLSLRSGLLGSDQAFKEAGEAAKPYQDELGNLQNITSEAVGKVFALNQGINTLPSSKNIAITTLVQNKNDVLELQQRIAALKDKTVTIRATVIGLDQLAASYPTYAPPGAASQQNVPTPGGLDHYPDEKDKGKGSGNTGNTTINVKVDGKNIATATVNNGSQAAQRDQRRNLRP